MTKFQTLIDLVRGKKRLMLQPSPKLMTNKQPRLYNQSGQLLETVYLKDIYVGTYLWQGDYMFFDRFNYGLDKHLYSHLSMLHTDGKPLKKYGIFVESEAIVPQDYMIFDKHPGLEKEFEKIFTWSERLLNKLPNADFFSAAGASVHNDDENLYQKKNKLVSMICSKKNDTAFHALRIKIARTLRDNALADVFGNLDGAPRFDKKEMTLAPYYFQVVVENDSIPYYFTEKIIDCFLELTIPVYIGATKIGQFFNADGIIQIKPEEYDQVDEIVKKLSPEFYLERVPAILENYRKAKDFCNTNKYLYDRMK